MLIFWTVQGRECAARFTIEAEGRIFIEDLRKPHGVQEIQLLDTDGARMEPKLSGRI